MLSSPTAAKKALIRRKQVAAASPAFVLEDYLFPQQLAFVLDPSPSKVAVCSRRAGKTTACAADLTFTCLETPEVVCLYITLSRSNAKKLIWPELKRINRIYKLNAEFNISELSVTYPNGSIIYCSGAKDSSEIEKFRGMAVKKAYIDEAQSFRSFIQELINDVLSPALMDYAGTLCLTGTPGPVPTGFFHSCSTRENTWSKHKWTFWDNPFIIKKSKIPHKEMLQRELDKRGVTTNDPSIQREYFGQWSLDTNSLLVHYNPAKNDYDVTPTPKPPDKWNYIMGIDLGFDDADAIAVIAWCEGDPATYLVDEKVVAKQGITELVACINEVSSRYEISKMVVDQGGLGKKIAEEMRVRHHLPLIPADKARKMENISFLNDSLRTGRFKAKAKSKFAEDSYLVEIDRDKSTPDKVKVSTAYHSDIIDAVLYAFRESPAYNYTPPKKTPHYGTKEWADAQESEMFEKEREGLLKEQEYFEYLKEHGLD